MNRRKKDLDALTPKKTTMAALENSSKKSSKASPSSTPNKQKTTTEERQTKSGRKVKPPKGLEDFEEIDLPKLTASSKKTITADIETPKKKLLLENIETTPRSAKKSRTLAETLLIEQTKMKITETPVKSKPTTPQSERKSARKIRTPAKLDDFERDEPVEVKKSIKKAKEIPETTTDDDKSKLEQPSSAKKSTRKTKASEQIQTPQKNAMPQEEDKPVTRGKKSTNKIEEQDRETPKKEEPIGRKSTRKTLANKQPEEQNLESISNRRRTTTATTRKLDKEPDKPIVKSSSSDEEVINVADRTKSGRKVKKPAFPDDSPPKSSLRSLDVASSDSNNDDDINEELKIVEVKSSRRKTKHEPKEVDLDIKDIFDEDEEKKSRRKTKNELNYIQEEIVQPMSKRKTRHELKEEKSEDNSTIEELPATSRSTRKKKIESPLKSEIEVLESKNVEEKSIKPSRSRKTLLIAEKSEDKNDEEPVAIVETEERPKRARKPTKRYEQEDDAEEEKKDEKKETKKVLNEKEETPKKITPQTEVLQSPRRARKQILPEISKNAAEDIKIVPLEPEVMHSKRAKRKTVATSRIETPKKEEPESSPKKSSRKTIMPTLLQPEEVKEPSIDAITPPLTPSKRARKSVHPHVSPEVEFQEEIVQFIEPIKVVSTRKKIKKMTSQSSSDEDQMAKTPSKNLEAVTLPEISRSGRKIKRPAFMDDFEDHVPSKKEKRMTKVVHQTGDDVSLNLDDKHSEENVTKRSRKSKHVVKSEVVKESPEFEENMQPEPQEDDIEKVLETIDNNTRTSEDQKDEIGSEEKEDAANDSIEKELEKMETIEEKEDEIVKKEINTTVEKTDEPKLIVEEKVDKVAGKNENEDEVKMIVREVEKIVEKVEKIGKEAHNINEHLKEIVEEEKVHEEVKKIAEEEKIIDVSLEKIDKEVVKEIEEESENVNEEKNDNENLDKNENVDTEQKEKLIAEDVNKEEVDVDNNENVDAENNEKLNAKMLHSEEISEKVELEMNEGVQEITENNETNEDVQREEENVSEQSVIEDEPKIDNKSQQIEEKMEIPSANIEMPISEKLTEKFENEDEFGDPQTDISNDTEETNEEAKEIPKCKKITDNAIDDAEINQEKDPIDENDEKTAETVEPLKMQSNEEESDKQETTEVIIKTNEDGDEDEEFEKLQVSIDEEDHDKTHNNEKSSRTKPRESIIDLTDSPLASKHKSSSPKTSTTIIKDECTEIIVIPETPAPPKSSNMNETFTPEKEIFEIPDTPMVPKTGSIDELNDDEEIIDEYEFDEEDYEQDDDQMAAFMSATYIEKSILKTGRKRSFSFCDADARKKNVKFYSPLVMEISEEKEIAPMVSIHENEIISGGEGNAGSTTNVDENGKNETETKMETLKNTNRKEKNPRKRSMSASYVHEKKKIDESGVRSGKLARIAQIKRPGSVRKGVPDFKAIHEKQFKNMQSIVDYDQMKKQRAKEMAAIKSPGMHMSQTSQLEKKVFQFGASSSKGNNTSQLSSSFVQSSKTQDRHNRHLDLSKRLGNSTDTNTTLKKRMEFCSKVRSNRRHDLLMKFRHEQEEKEKSNK